MGDPQTEWSPPPVNSSTCSQLFDDFYSNYVPLKSQTSLVILRFDIAFTIVIINHYQSLLVINPYCINHYQPSIFNRYETLLMTKHHYQLRLTTTSRYKSLSITLNHYESLNIYISITINHYSPPLIIRPSPTSGSRLWHHNGAGWLRCEPSEAPWGKPKFHGKRGQGHQNKDDCFDSNPRAHEYYIVVNSNC